MIIDVHKTHLPFMTPYGNEVMICICTVLRKGGGNDCAAYQAIIPDISTKKDREGLTEILLDKVSRGGNKLREEDAAKLFKFIDKDGNKLEYRP